MNRKPEIVIEQFGNDGWFFITSPDIPTFCFFGTREGVRLGVKDALFLAAGIEAERVVEMITHRPTNWHPRPELSEALVAVA